VAGISAIRFDADLQRLLRQPQVRRIQGPAAVDQSIRNVETAARRFEAAQARPDLARAGRRFRIMTVVDDCTRECLALIADTWLSGARVARERATLFEACGKLYRPTENLLMLQRRRWR
jgi:hypothetical protein